MILSVVIGLVQAPATVLQTKSAATMHTRLLADPQERIMLCLEAATGMWSLLAVKLNSHLYLKAYAANCPHIKSSNCGANAHLISYLC